MSLNCLGNRRPLKLRHKIIIQQPTYSIGSAGGNILTWSDYAPRKAKAIPKGGQETFRLQQFFSEANMMFLLRHDSLTKAITSKMRVSFDSRFFDIIAAINEDELNQTIKLVCTEKT